MGLNPQVDGELIRIPIPALSEERRKELVKVGKKHGEECKVSIRKVRHEALDLLAELEKDGGAGKDEVERAKKKAEEVVSESGTAVDQIVQQKEKEILAI
jgi:ribosome recycling factor